MRKKILILFVLAGCCNVLYAQWPAEYKTRDSIIAKSVSGLQQKGVDTIAVYSQFGSLIFLPNSRSDEFPNYDPNRYDACSSKETFMVFMIWKKNGKNFFTFKTKCYDHPVKTLPDSGLWSYYVANCSSIENDKPKEPLLKHVNLQTEEITIGKDKMTYKEAENNQYIMMVGHHKTTVNMGYRLYEKFGNRGDQNLNYTYNINLPVKKLQLKLEALCRPMVIVKELTLAAKN